MLQGVEGVGKQPKGHDNAAVIAFVFLELGAVAMVNRFRSKGPVTCVCPSSHHKTIKFWLEVFPSMVHPFISAALQGWGIDVVVLEVIVV